MKRRYIYFPFILFLSLALGCTSNSGNANNQKKTVVEVPVCKYSTGCVGEIKFRRSYHIFKELSDKELEKEYERLEKQLPTLIGYETDDWIIELFSNKGWVKSGGLVLANFKYDTAHVKRLKINNSKEVLSLKFEIDHEGLKLQITGLLNGKKCFETSCHYNPLQGLKYCLVDLIPGGLPELVIYDQWYIANGDNYDFTVYQFSEN